MEASGIEAAQVLLLPILDQELSCCLQDPRLPLQPAKPLLRNALGPELSCCLQDSADAACGPGTSDVRGYEPMRRGAPSGTAASNRDCQLATFWGYRGRRRGIQDRLRSFAGGSRCGADTGKQLRRKPSGEAETSMAERTSDSSGRAVPS